VVLDVGWDAHKGPEVYSQISAFALGPSDFCLRLYRKTSLLKSGDSKGNKKRVLPETFQPEQPEQGGRLGMPGRGNLQGK